MNELVISGATRRRSDTRMNLTALRAAGYPHRSTDGNGSDPTMKYDPEVDQPADKWLATGEADRIAAVEAYHRHHRIRLPGPRLHATVHTIVENQLALGEQVVIGALARLRSEGLSRHEAVHAIGMVLAEQIYEVLRDESGAKSDLNKPYPDQVRQLTADQWRQSGESNG